MTQTVMRAPVFTQVVSSGIDESEKTIVLEFLDAENKHYEVEVSVECAGLATVALLSELGRLLAKFPDESPPQIQPIVATSMRGALRDDGKPVLFVGLENKASLVMEIPRDLLSDIARIFDELHQASAPPDTKH